MKIYQRLVSKDHSNLYLKNLLLFCYKHTNAYIWRLKKGIITTYKRKMRKIKYWIRHSPYWIFSFYKSLHCTADILYINMIWQVSVFSQTFRVIIWCWVPAVIHNLSDSGVNVFVLCQYIKAKKSAKLMNRLLAPLRFTFVVVLMGKSASKRVSFTAQRPTSGQW